MFEYDTVNRRVFIRLRKVSSDGADVTSVTSNRKGSVANGGPVGLWLDEAAIVLALLAVLNVTAHQSTASVPTSYCSMWHSNSRYETYEIDGQWQCQICQVNIACMQRSAVRCLLHACV